LLGLAYWAGQFASQVTDGHSVYQDMVRYSRYVTTLHDQEPVSFQRLTPKSSKSKQYNLDSLEINEMEKAIEDEAKDDPRYLQDIVAASIVIATRIPNSEISEDSTKMNDFVAICENLIHWALTTGQEDEITNECQISRKKKKPDVAMNTAKALVKATSEESITKKKHLVNHVKALKHLGQAFFELENFEQAKIKLNESLVRCNEIIDQNPSEVKVLKAEILQIQGKCHFELGDFDLCENNSSESSKKCLENALELVDRFKKDQDLTPYNSELVASIHLDLSNTLLELNDFDNALMHAEKGENLIRGLPQDQQTKEKIVPMYLTKGKCLMHIGDLFNAIGVLKEALDVNKDKVETEDFLNNWKMEKATFNAYLAVCYMSSGQLLEAYDQVEIALDECKKVSKVEGHFKCKLLTTLFY
jgi:tetratricopeptide (TPR) repeat protein